MFFTAKTLFRLCIVLVSMTLGLAQDEDIVVDEELRVHHYLLEVRAYDKRGDILENLSKDDWRVTTRYKELKVVSSQWIDMSRPRPIAESEAEQSDVVESDLFEWKEPRRGRGRLIVLFFQGETGFYNRTYVGLTQYFRLLLGKLEPQDYVAVASLDNHLKLHCDFTQDWEVILAALENAALRRPGSLIDPGPGPAMAKHFDFEKAKQTYASDVALKIIADSLIPVAGQKTLVFVGYAMGRARKGPHVIMNRRYDKTLDAMNRANLTVFSFGYAAKNNRMVLGGLRQVAWDTGGEMLTSMNDLVDSMKGYHLLEIQADEPIKKGAFKVRLRDQYGTFTYRLANLDRTHDLTE